MKFVDSCEVDVVAGKGGNGAIAFRREKFVPFGGPSGGDGGRGGDVVFVADEGLSTLVDLTYGRVIRAQSGEQGHGKDMYGRGGEDAVVRVPVGTQIIDRDSGELLFDIDKPGTRVVVAKGGKGGRGNIHFATPYDRAPRRAEPGEEGEEKRLRLELKVIADVGLLGFPNVGKSTFIRAVSRARPKVADYPFTTLTPHLGVVRVGDEASFVVADIPGLIPGAAEGAGLGHRFLKHVERTRALLHLVTLDFDEERDPLKDYDALMNELEQFDAELAKRPQIVAMTKADIPEVREAYPQVKERFASRGIELHLVSSATGEGVRELSIELYKLVTGRTEVEDWERPAVAPTPLPTDEAREVEASVLEQVVPTEGEAPMTAEATFGEEERDGREDEAPATAEPASEEKEQREQPAPLTAEAPSEEEEEEEAPVTAEPASEEKEQGEQAAPATAEPPAAEAHEEEAPATAEPPAAEAHEEEAPEAAEPPAAEAHEEEEEEEEAPVTAVGASEEEEAPITAEPAASEEAEEEEEEEEAPETAELAPAAANAVEEEEEEEEEEPSSEEAVGEARAPEAIASTEEEPEEAEPEDVAARREAIDVTEEEEEEEEEAAVAEVEAEAVGEETLEEPAEEPPPSEEKPVTPKKKAVAVKKKAAAPAKKKAAAKKKATSPAKKKATTKKKTAAHAKKKATTKKKAATKKAARAAKPAKKASTKKKVATKASARPKKSVAKKPAKKAAKKKR